MKGQKEGKKATAPNSKAGSGRGGSLDNIDELLDQIDDGPGSPGASKTPSPRRPRFDLGPQAAEDEVRDNNDGINRIRRSYQSDTNLFGKLKGSHQGTRPRSYTHRPSIAHRHFDLVENWEHKHVMPNPPQTPLMRASSFVARSPLGDPPAYQQSFGQLDASVDELTDLAQTGDILGRMGIVTAQSVVTNFNPTRFFFVFLTSLFLPFVDIFPKFAAIFLPDLISSFAIFFSLLFFGLEVSVAYLYLTREVHMVSATEILGPLVLQVMVCLVYSYIVSKDVEQIDDDDASETLLDFEIKATHNGSSGMMRVRGILDAIDINQEYNSLEEDISWYYNFAKIGALLYSLVPHLQRASRERLGFFWSIARSGWWFGEWVSDVLTGEIHRLKDGHEELLCWFSIAISFFLTWGCLLALSLAVSVYSRRLQCAHSFGILTSPSRAAKLGLPTLKLESVREIRGWLILRNHLQRRGPQYTVDTIVSVAVLTVVCLSVSIPIVRLVWSTSQLPVDHLTLSCFIGAMILGVYLRKILLVGTHLSKRYNDRIMIMTQQLRITLRFDIRLTKEEKETMEASKNALDMLVKVFKEIEEASQIQVMGFSLNDTFLRVLVGITLSTLSFSFTSVMGYPILIR